MAFINEYISEENIEKYNIESLYKKWLIDLPPRFEYAWTFDKDRNSYYIPMQSGREEESNQTEGVFFFRGIPWCVNVYLEDGGSHSFKDNPFRRTLGLTYIRDPEGGLVPESEILSVLKEALSAYQISGIRTPAGMNIVTSFNF